MKTFSEATDAFLKKASNLGDAELPLVVALKKTAQELDNGGLTASLVNQYRLTYVALAERAFGTDEEIDPLEALLDV